MSKEHEKQTIQDLIATILAIVPVDGYQTYKEWVGGKLTFTAEPIEPFKVDEDGCFIGYKYNDNAPPFSGNDDVDLVFPGGSVHIDPATGAATLVLRGEFPVKAL